MFGQEILGWKKFWIRKNVGSKKFFGPKISGQKKCWSKKKNGSKIILGQTSVKIRYTLIMKLGQMLQGQMLSGLMSPRKLPMNTDALTNQP